MRKPFTDRFLQSVKPPPAGERPVECWDSKTPGLGFRVGATDTRTFHVMTRCNGRQVRHIIGPYPATKLADARDEAGEIIRQARKGVDPRERQRQARREAERAQRDTFAVVVDHFIEKYAKPRNRRWADTERTFRVNVIPLWGTRPIASIDRRDVIALIEKIAEDRGGYMSNRTLGALKTMFRWAVKRDIIDANPAAPVDPVFEEVSRERVLSDAELRAFWQGTETDHYPWHDFLRVLLLTAQRRGEVATMRWDDINLESDKPIWTIPAELNKSARIHDVPLAPEVVEILQSLPRHQGRYLFTSGDGTIPISNFATAKRRLDKKMLEILGEAAEDTGDDPGTVEIPRWTLHDLRRSAATGMAQLGIQPVVLGRVLNHSPGALMGVTAIYNRFAYDTEKRAALEAWARRVEEIVTQTPLNNVVPLAR